MNQDIILFEHQIWIESGQKKTPKQNYSYNQCLKTQSLPLFRFGSTYTFMGTNANPDSLKTSTARRWHAEIIILSNYETLKY